ncbi:hypothetical protein [Xenorhabdus taiwanensis]|uniref:Phage protein n=1 Tax=Xenorhabdus taiwanensis TaxID=3085177 RepID=A0ABM8K176_9GAMM|nr:hypothetical protein TCT1_22530 [Xenorhabdus sp. TCT-1]BET97755.1 hypothetical protein TCT1_26760 [Xenorhabdus sp. TCT-1]
MSRITLTIKQIQYACDMVGISYEEVEENRLNEEYTICDKLQIEDINGSRYIGKAIYCTDYPEDGAMPLEDK